MRFLFIDISDDIDIVDVSCEHDGAGDRVIDSVGSAGSVVATVGSIDHAALGAGTVFGVGCVIVDQ